MRVRIYEGVDISSASSPPMLFVPESRLDGLPPNPDGGTWKLLRIEAEEKEPLIGSVGSRALRLQGFFIRTASAQKPTD